jgi:hypothetical protein
MHGRGSEGETGEQSGEPVPFTLPRNMVKGKAVPLQAWSGPEGSRKLRFPDFMTTAQDGFAK